MPIPTQSDILFVVSIVVTIASAMIGAFIGPFAVRDTLAEESPRVLSKAGFGAFGGVVGGLLGLLVLTGLYNVFSIYISDSGSIAALVGCAVAGSIYVVRNNC